MSKTIEFRCSPEDYSIQDFINYFHDDLPQMISVTEGFCGIDEALTYGINDVLRITHIHKQARVVARDTKKRYISIPLDYPLKFCVVDRHGRKESPQRLSEIIEHDYHNGEGLHLLAEKNDVINFWHGTDQTYTKLGTLTIQKKYEEPYLVGNAVIFGKLDSSVAIIPSYVPIQVAIVEGLKSGTRVDYMKVLSNIKERGKELRNHQIKGNGEIMLYEGSLQDENMYEYIKPRHFMKPNTCIDENSNPEVHYVNLPDDSIDWTKSEIYSKAVPELPPKGIPRTLDRPRKAINPVQGIVHPAKSYENLESQSRKPEVQKDYRQKIDTQQSNRYSKTKNSEGEDKLLHKHISSRSHEPSAHAQTRHYSTAYDHIISSKSIPKTERSPKSSKSSKDQKHHKRGNPATNAGNPEKNVRELSERQKTMMKYIESQKARHSSPYIRMDKFDQQKEHLHMEEAVSSEYIQKSISSGDSYDVATTSTIDIATASSSPRNVPEISDSYINPNYMLKHNKSKRHTEKQEGLNKFRDFENNVYILERTEDIIDQSVMENPPSENIIRDKQGARNERNIQALSISDIGQCLMYLNLNQYVKVFEAKRIDGAFLLDLDMDDLMDDFGFTRTDSKRLLKFAKESWLPKV